MMDAVVAANFERFSAKCPIPVMVRATMERILAPARLDEIFARSAVRQYTRELLFSSVFALMCRTVCGSSKSLHVAYLESTEEIAVSLTSVYNKVAGIEPGTSAAMVRETAADMEQLINALPNGRRAPWVKGYRVRILDGNCLAATEHRLTELRYISSGALPGKSLAVFDPTLEMIVDVFPCEDGHAQERALLGEVLPTVQPGDLVIADRNICTRRFVSGVVLDRNADVLLREHGNMPVEATGRIRKIGRIETGLVREQSVQMVDEQGRVVKLRRIIVELDEPTRDGDRQIRILTSAPKTPLSAKRVARLYRRRWRIETAFQHLEKNLRSEINTLAYPRAALFGFCVAVVAFNILAVTFAALRSVHGEETIANEVSGYHVAHHMASNYSGMMAVLPDEEWTHFGSMSIKQFANHLHTLAKKVDLRRYPRKPRGPKKPPPKRISDPSRPHVSTAQLLAGRRPGSRKG